MAKSSKQGSKEGKKSNGEPNSLPAGFESVTPDDADRTWLRKTAGCVVHGVLKGRYKKPKRGYFYQIMLLSPAPAIKGRGEEAESFEAERGSTLNVDESTALEVLAPFCEDGGRYEVYIRFLEKIELEGGNSFWRTQVGKKVLSPPTRSVPKKKEEDEDMSDVPF